MRVNRQAGFLRALSTAGPFLLFIGVASAGDLPRDGKVTVPSKPAAIALCRENPYINSNFLLRSCVQMEQQSAEQVLSMMSRDKDAASEAYWVCVKNPFINSYFLLSACMRQELEAGAFLKQ